jgi:hypothetical protein
MRPNRAGQLELPLWSRSTKPSEHDLEDERTIAAVEALFSLYGPALWELMPSLSRRLRGHVAVGDCPLGLRQFAAAAHLIEAPG